VSVSATVPPFRDHTFVAANLKDGRLETSWQYRHSDDKPAGRFVMRFPEPMEIRAVRIANGMQLDSDEFGDLFMLNSRVRSATMSLSGKKFEINLASDKRGFIDFEFSPPVISNSLVFQIESVWPGSRWNDLAISEFRVLGHPAGRESTSSAPPPATPPPTPLPPPPPSPSKDANRPATPQEPHEPNGAIANENPSVAEFTQRALSLRKAGQPGQAIMTFRQAIDKSPSFVWARYGLAGMFGSLGRTREAMNELEAISRIGTSEAKRALRLAADHPDFAGLRDSPRFSALTDIP